MRTILTQTSLAVFFLAFFAISLLAKPQDTPKLEPSMILTSSGTGSASLQVMRTLSTAANAKQSASIVFRPKSGATTIAFIDKDTKSTLATSRTYTEKDALGQDVFELAWQHTGGKKPAHIAIKVTVKGGSVELFDGPRPQPVADANKEENFDDLDALRDAAAGLATEGKHAVSESDHAGVCTDPSHHHGPGGAIHATPAKRDTTSDAAKKPTSRNSKK